MTDEKGEAGEDYRIRVTKDGPYIVTGGVPLSDQIIESDEDGFSHKWKQGKEHISKESYALCRCGKSKNKPYCDGGHIKAKFNGEETASRKPFDEAAETIEGPKLVLRDATELCAFARYCDRGDGVWSYTRNSGDPDARKAAIDEACKCPSGRLVAVDPKIGEPYEEEYPPSIGVVEDPQMGCSGPLWVRGGIPIEGANGKPYETRNRVTLCRCGKSSNKPFCDGSHAE
jgi:CDGSH-type Zn-finger protein